MATRKLPPEGSPELEEIKARFRRGERRQIAAEVGMTAGALANAMADRGVRVEREPPVKPFQLDSKAAVNKAEQMFRELLREKIQAIPDLDIPSPPTPGPRRGTPEEQVALFSDSQCGVKFRTYNRDVFLQRVRELAQKIMRIATIQRYAHPLHDLNLFFLGDLVHGERVGRQVNLDDFECPAHEQILDIFVPACCEFLLTLLQHYRRIRIYSVEGNHGWPGGKDSGYGTNWDTFAMELVKAKLARYTRIEFDVERHAFYKLVQVQGHYFLLVHGDQINMHMTVPFYGVTTKGLRWKGSIDVDMDFAEAVMNAYRDKKMPLDEAVARMLQLPFQYLCMGHFHTANYLTFNDVTTFMNGCLPTGDTYPLKKMGLAGEACQWTFGVHPQQGRTFMYPLVLH